MTNQLRPGLPKLPPKMAFLDIDDRGYPVPFFVAYIDGKPDFRISDPEKFTRCVQENLCWVCGGKLGRYIAFVIGPMCSVNRVSSEPPQHRECAEWSVQGCPFLSMPKMVRRENDLAEHCDAAGITVKRNPGVALVWHTTFYQILKIKADPVNGVQAGYLFRVGEPLQCDWWCEGREATLEEVEESINTGLPQLAEGVPFAELNLMMNSLLPLLPKPKEVFNGK